MIPFSNPEHPAQRQIEAAVLRILKQPEFIASRKLSVFLKFVVDEKLAGRQNQIKAFTIATAVYGRNESFDPQTNSLVRVEALRLRRLLDAYYVSSGKNDPIKITIPRGSYVPQFIQLQPAEGANDNITPTAPALTLFPRSRTRKLAALAGMAVIGATGLFWIASANYGQAIGQGSAALNGPPTPAFTAAAPSPNVNQSQN